MQKLFVILAIIACTPLVSHAAVVNTSSSALRNGLVGHWTFDGKDIVSGVIRDVSGQGNHGNTVSIATTTFYTPGKIGQGIKFDGNNDSVTLGTPAALQLSSGFTWSYWTYLKATGGNTSSFLRWSGNGGYFSKFTGAKVVFGRTNIQNDLSSTQNISLNTWYHVVTTVDGSGNVTLYINAVQDNSGTTSVTSPTGTLTFGSGASDVINGIVDDMRVYNRVLTTSEIRQLYNMGNQAVKVNTSQNNTSSVTRNLLGHWTFDGKDMPSGRVGDASRNGNTGYVSNISTTTFYTAGKIGQGIKFDGVDDLVNIPEVVQGQSQLTVAAWYRTSDLTTRQFLVEEVGAGQDPVDLNYGSGTGGNDSRFDCTLMNDATSGSTGFSSQYTDGDWHHVVCTWDGSTITLYVDGVVDATTGSLTGPLAAGTPDLVISSDDSTGVAKGSIDDVRIYSRSLTAAEVSTLYTLGNHGTKTQVTRPDRLTSGLLSHWTFDGKDMANGVARDVSGQGNHGNLISIATSTFYSVGKIGQGLLFDGSNDRVLTGSDFIGTNSVTVTAWVKPRSGGQGNNGRIVDNGRFIFELATTNRLGLSSNGSTLVSNSNNTVPLNTWTFVAATRDSAGVTNFYINGVQNGTANADSGTPSAGTTNVNIGNRNGADRTFDGILDDVRVYGRILSAAEISQIYNIGR